MPALAGVTAWPDATGAHGADKADAEALRDAVTQHGLTQPCALDNEGTLRAAFQLEANELGLLSVRR